MSLIGSSVFEQDCRSFKYASKCSSTCAELEKDSRALCRKALRRQNKLPTRERALGEEATARTDSAVNAGTFCASRRTSVLTQSDGESSQAKQVDPPRSRSDVRRTRRLENVHAISCLQYEHCNAIVIRIVAYDVPHPEAVRPESSPRQCPC